ncbi:MAG TPA: ATP-binding cassette domain-containing protein [Actinomycetota bacterium]
MNGTDSSVISIEGLSKVFAGPPRVTAVDGIDLQVARAETFGLLGPNGAGKTTTVGICTTRIRPTAGRAVVAGVDVTRDPVAVKRSIGVVTQFNTLDRACTVWENLYLHCRFFGMSAGPARRRADDLLTRFRLSEHAAALPAQLSGGMAQRLQVARALAHRPTVLFLDEPTAGLDPQSRLALWEIVADLKRDGVTVLLTTHYMEEADALCERVAIIDHGKVLVCDDPAKLKRGLGAETVVNLHLDQVTDDLQGRLRALPAVVKVEPVEGGLRVMVTAGDGAVPAIAHEALGSGLRDMSVNEPSLETVFINLTGRELRE